MPPPWFVDVTKGYTVEWGRSCYSSQWRLGPPGSQPVRGFYCFSPPGRPVYPGLHYVGSLNWVTDDRDPFQDPPLGEVSYNALTNPRPWFNGDCSNPPPVPDDAGLELDGQGETPPAMEYHADGGLEASGDGTVPPYFEVIATGGLEADGTSPPSFVYVATGGLEADGAANTIPPVPPVPPTPPPPPGDAGLELGGEGETPPDFTYYAEGGLELGGEGETPPDFPYHAEGGLELDGEGETPPDFPYHAEGGLELDGEGDSPLSLDYHADGGLELDGEGDSPLSLDYHADGGLELGGDQAPPTYSVWVPGCDHPVPNVLKFQFLAAFCPFTPPRSTWIVYDPADSKWKGSLGIPLPGQVFRFELESTGPNFSDWLLTMYCPNSGETSTSPPVLGICFPFVAEYSMGPALVLACGCLPQDDWLVRITAEP